MKANYLKYILFFTLLLSPLTLLYASSGYVGINETNLNKIAIGIIDLGLPDSDHDGIDNDLEKSLGTSYVKKDSDTDGFDDKTEIANSYNPVGKNKITTDQKLVERLAGQFLLRVEKRGELWYVNPKNNKRYLVGNATRKKLLFEKLNQLTTASDSKPIAESNVINELATAIRTNNKEKALSLVATNYRGAVSYTFDTLNTEQKFIWANMLSGAKLTSQTETKKIYSTNVYFGLANKNVTSTFETTKQSDGTWLISKL